MTLIKTSVLSAIATAITMINSFVVVKIIAVYIGPSGMAFIGQFQNFITVLMSFATGAINGGVVKYTAEYREDEQQKQKLWSTALRVSFIATLLTAGVISSLHHYLSAFFFKSDEFQSIFLIFSATLFLFVLNSLFIAILNGQKEIKKLVTVNIISSFVSLCLTTSFAYRWGLYGALLSYTTGQALVFFVTLVFVFKSQWFKFKFFTAKLDKNYLKKLSGYTAMALTSALTMPVSQMLIRDYIGQSISWEAAGYWEGVWRISNSYLGLVTTTLGIYYLPRLSEIKENKELRKEIFYGYKVILPIVISSSIAIYYLRDFIILVLFTEKFTPMRDLFLFQIIGNIFKIASWLLGFLMHAKAMAKTFIVTEVIFSLSFLLLSIVCLESYGIVGVTISFAVNYFIYLLVLVFIFRKIIIEKL
jgi:PST family polysaccharide transporter